jgi:hypothetical protein
MRPHRTVTTAAQSNPNMGVSGREPTLGRQLSEAPDASRMFDDRLAGLSVVLPCHDAKRQGRDGDLRGDRGGRQTQHPCRADPRRPPRRRPRPAADQGRAQRGTRAQVVRLGAAPSGAGLRWRRGVDAVQHGVASPARGLAARRGAGTGAPPVLGVAAALSSDARASWHASSARPPNPNRSFMPLTGSVDSVAGVGCQGGSAG